MKDIEGLEILGEESGCEEAAIDFPVTEEIDYRKLYQCGRGRAQGLHELRGKQARKFAQSAYTTYYAPWHHADTLEQVIANVAAAMGVIGCEATFVVRKDVVREMIEKESV